MRLIILSLFLSVSLFAEAINFTAQQKKWMKEHPVITYVGDPNWLPYEGYNNKGQYVGLVPDIIEIVSAQTPLKFKHIKTSTWKESIDLVTCAKVMMISQSKYSNRDVNLSFSSTYFENPLVYVMQEGEKYVPSIYTIAKKRIGLMNNNTTRPIFEKQYPHIDFILFTNISEGLQSVAVGEIDVFICSLPRAGYEIAHNRLLNLRIVGKSKVNMELGFGVNKNYSPLVGILNKLIKETPHEKIHKVLSKWSRQKYVEKVDHTLLYISLVIFLIIVVMGTLFYLRLKHESQKRIHLQDKMLEQQAKMASMGEMMDAVAHQWKQPLNALSMYGELLKSDYDEGLVNKAYLEEMLEGVDSQIEHMTTTLGEFRNFFRPSKGVLNFKLLDIINSVLFLVKDEFMKNSIRVKVNINEGLSIKGNENEFKHLILNIINNAKDAFNEKDIKDRQIIIEAYVEEENILLSIQDSAGGISEKVLESLFEANVTTKQEGKGTGIGLYMSRQIVHKLKGEIWVENTSQGACFKIKLPL